MADPSLTTPLYDWHRGHGGRMVDFAGWSMPVQYTSIVDEHRATRGAVGVFDISHMGRLRFDGEHAAQFLDGLLTREVVGLGAGRIRYSLMVNEQGFVLDDVLIYHLLDPGGSPYYLLVVNAGNRSKIVDWISSHGLSQASVVMTDLTRQTAMIAVQGPHAVAIAAPLIDRDLAALKYFNGTPTHIGGHAAIVSRTGYTGEDGCELIVPAEAAEETWKSLLVAAQAVHGKPAGLGARDSLRLEAAMPLYGHELSEALNPFDAGLDFAVNLAGRDFIGSRSLAECRQSPPARVRIGLELDGRRVPREGFRVLDGERPVGAVTSGTFSPTLERPIAMAYVQPEAARARSQLAVEIRDEPYPARIVDLPFYRRGGER